MWRQELEFTVEGIALSLSLVILQGTTCRHGHTDQTVREIPPECWRVKDFKSVKMFIQSHFLLCLCFIYSLFLFLQYQTRNRYNFIKLLMPSESFQLMDEALSAEIFLLQPHSMPRLRGNDLHDLSICLFLFSPSCQRLSPSYCCCSSLDSKQRLGKWARLKYYPQMHPLSCSAMGSFAALPLSCEAASAPCYLRLTVYWFKKKAWEPLPTEILCIWYVSPGGWGLWGGMFKENVVSFLPQDIISLLTNRDKVIV